MLQFGPRCGTQGGSNPPHSTATEIGESSEWPLAIYQLSNNLDDASDFRVPSSLKLFSCSMNCFADRLCSLVKSFKLSADAKFHRVRNSHAQNKAFFFGKSQAGTRFIETKIVN